MNLSGKAVQSFSSLTKSFRVCRQPQHVLSTVCMDLGKEKCTKELLTKRFRVSKKEKKKKGAMQMKEEKLPKRGDT